MPDLGKSDALWLDYFERKALIMAGHRYLKEVRDRFRFERTQAILLPVNTVYADDDTITLSGVNLGTNTDANGELWVRITESGGTYTISLYTASGASGLVAQGGATQGNTATLTAQNSSGLSGTWGVPSSAATVTSDILKLSALPDFREQARARFDGTLAKDAIELNRFGDAFEQVASDLLTAMGRMESLLNAYATGDDRQAEDFTGLAFDALATESESENDGAVTQRRSGYTNVIRQAMADETTGSTQDVQRIAQNSTSGTAGSNNAGSGAIASFTPREHCPAMTVTFTCDEGVESGAVGRERFIVTGKFAGESRSELLGIATVEQSFEGAFGFGPLTITHTFSKTNDGSNDDFVAATSATIANITSEFSDNGDLYVRLSANSTNPSNFDIGFYKSQSGATNALTGELVALAENVASGAAFVATQRNSSRIQISWQLGGSESAGSDIVLSYNAFKETNSSGAPDSFTVVTSRSSEGLVQKTYVDMVERGSLNSTASSPQLPDGLVRRGCFVPYVVLDN